MPSENLQSQSHRPSLGGHRSTSSIHSQTDSPSSTPPQHGKTKPQKHHVGGGGRIHARVPSTKSMHKYVKGHGHEHGSHDNLKKLGRNASATHLKKNNSHVSLKRNQSSSDVPSNRRPRSSHGKEKRNSAVHFEIGDRDVDVEGDGPELEGEEADGDGDGWEEASSSASPALSRSASRPGSAKQSAPNTQPPSPHASFKVQQHLPPTSPVTPAAANGSSEKQKQSNIISQQAHVRHSTADAKIITERLLQRTPSQHTTTKMSLATATPAKATASSRAPTNVENTQDSNPTTSQFSSGKSEVVSRFVSGSGTPKDVSTFLNNRSNSPSKQDEIKRAQSMGNLTRRDSEDVDDEPEPRALAPRSRKSSNAGNGYIPPQQSRTQQKLWLQRASSNIEPQQLPLGIGGVGVGTPLLGGAGYDGRDPRIKIQLEKTGLEYLVVRRHQDPVGLALKRLQKLPGMEKIRRIPEAKGQNSRKGGAGDKDRDSLGRRAGLGLSQSLKDARKGGAAADSGISTGAGSYGSAGNASGRDEDEGVSAILRSLWEKNFDFSSSAD